VENGVLTVLHVSSGAKFGDLHAKDSTVALEKDSKMSETMIGDSNLPNPHLFEPLFCTHAWYHPSPYYYFIFEAIGNSA